MLSLALKIIGQNYASNVKIAEDVHSLGPGFCIGHSYFCPPIPPRSLDEHWYRRIVKTEIAPLIREYWFDKPKSAEDAVSELLRGLLGIPIRNLYFLFCYAWRRLPEDMPLEVGASEFGDVANLCAHILSLGINRLARRGIDRNYLATTEVVSRLRGRVNPTESLNGLALLNRKSSLRF